MFQGRAYGLVIESSIPLPELAASDAAVADVVVRQGTLDRSMFTQTDCARQLIVTPSEVRLLQPGVGAFLMRNGCEVIMDPEPQTTAEILRHWALGPALAVLLHQRGLCVLHASAVVVGSRAVAFLGSAGSGKSTTARAFYARGHAIVADDVVAVEMTDPVPRILSAFPRLRLWPDSLDAFGDVAEQWPLVHPALSKREHVASNGFQTGPLPLQRIYVLASGESAVIEEIGPHRSLVELVRHAYTAPLFEGTGTSSINFQQVSRLVRKDFVRQLVVPRSLARIDYVVTRVERDLQPTIQ